MSKERQIKIGKSSALLLGINQTNNVVKVTIEFVSTEIVSFITTS